MLARSKTKIIFQTTKLQVLLLEIIRQKQNTFITLSSRTKALKPLENITTAASDVSSEQCHNVTEIKSSEPVLEACGGSVWPMYNPGREESCDGGSAYAC